jgi:hypothetical protein
MNSTFHVLGWMLLVSGWVLAFLGSLWIIILGWQRSYLWGIACFLIPITQLFYVGLHWKESKEAFVLQVSGFVLVILAGLSGVPRS